MNVGHGCTTTKSGDVAIGFGKGVVVSASGGFNTSIAIGNKAEAHAEGLLIGNGSTGFAGLQGRGNRFAVAFGHGKIADDGITTLTLNPTSDQQQRGCCSARWAGSTS